MKKLLVLVAVFGSLAPLNAGWFSNDREISKLEQQLQQKEESKGKWQGLAVILGVGCVVSVVIGAAIGSKVRKNGNQ